ncbi:hypothetical protein Tco_0934894 [Tanacetum coccineum]
MSKFYNLCTILVNFYKYGTLPPREQRHPFLRYQGLEYTNTDIADFEERLERIHDRDTHRVQVVDFQGMPELMRDVLDSRMLMEHRDDGGFQLGRAKRRMSRRQFIVALGLHTEEEMESLVFLDTGKGDLRDYWRSISIDGDFLGPPLPIL